MGRLLTLDEVADRLRISIEHVRNFSRWEALRSLLRRLGVRV